MTIIVLYIFSTVVIFAFILFLLYLLSKNDLMLIRKNISQEQVFNIFFLFLIGGLITGRIYYIFSGQLSDMIHPIRFLHFIKFPGLSLFGTYLGFFFLAVLIFHKKMVLKRILDIFFISLFPTLFLYITTISFIDWKIKASGILSLLVLFFYLIRLNRNYSLKDGTFFAIIMVINSLIFFILDFNTATKIYEIFTFTQIISIITIFSLLVFIVKNENLLKFK